MGPKLLSVNLDFYGGPENPSYLFEMFQKPLDLERKFPWSFQKNGEKNSFQQTSKIRNDSPI